MNVDLQSLFARVDVLEENKEKITRVRELQEEFNTLQGKLTAAIGELPSDLVNMFLLHSDNGTSEQPIQSAPTVAQSNVLSGSKRVSFGELDTLVLQLIKQSNTPVSSRALCAATGLDYPRIAQSLKRLNGKLKQVAADPERKLSRINTAYVVKGK
jgi:hypothetical protein